jgi:hypothetical protein
MILKINQNTLLLVLLLCISLSTVLAQQTPGVLRGQIKDAFGGAVVGATVRLESKNVAVKSTQTDGQGYFTFGGLHAGRYKLVARAEGFATYENDTVEVKPGLSQLNFKLNVATIAADVMVVDRTSALDIDPEKDASALVIRGTELDALPDDPDELAMTLQVLSGSPGNGQFYLDGFEVSNLPAKRNIREVRISQNPFSAEFATLGTNRIEIFTKPGTEKFHSSAFFTFSDESLNARDPFASRRAPFQSRLLSGNVSGPIHKKSDSFFLDFERRETDDNGIINATILDPSLHATLLNQLTPTPKDRTWVSLRVDQKLNRTNTLVARYSYLNLNARNDGVGAFSLPQQALNTSQTEQTFQLTETAVLAKSVVNETRFQFIRDRLSQSGDNSTPTINVLDAFIDGGSLEGQSSTTTSRWELQNHFFFGIGKHNLKAGVQLRGVSLNDVSTRNFGGTFTFAGGSGVQLDGNNQVVYVDGNPQFVALTSLERFRRTLLFGQQGLPANVGSLTLSDLGVGPSQFSMTAGAPEAHVNQLYFSAFVQDDWRVRANLTLSAGLRYEVQNNVRSVLDLGPRLRFAWAPGTTLNRQPKTMIRGGIGIFYSRFDEDLTLQAIRFNGVDQRQYIITDPSALQSFPRLPDLTNASSLVPQTIIRVADDARTPYTIQTAIGIDRQLPHNVMLSATYLNASGFHLLRSRNINAPLPGTFMPDSLQSGVRPLGGSDNIYLIESSGRLKQQQLFVRLSSRFGRTSLFGSYILTYAKSDTDGPFSFPANSYDLSTDWGRSLLDVRHRVFVEGTIDLPWGLHLNPLIVAWPGRPFNIITGQDTNGDTLFTERPAFADTLSKPGTLITRFGAFDLNPTTGEQIIPRNFGTGPPLFAVNLRLSKTINFGGGGQTFTRGNSGSNDEGTGGSTATQGDREKRYSLTLSLRVQNLFNRVNAAPPVGNLSSLLFGQSTSSDGSFSFRGNAAGGNRRIEMQIGFTF